MAEADRIVAFVDEAGEKGFSRKLTEARDDGVGLLCSLSFPSERPDEMRARFKPGFDRFAGACPPDAKPHVADAFVAGREGWADIARSVRDEFFGLVRELELPVIYEARRGRVDRQSHEHRSEIAKKARAGRRSSVRLPERPDGTRLEEALITGLLLKLDALGETYHDRLVDLCFDETDHLDLFRKHADRVSTTGQPRKRTVKGWDENKKVPVKAEWTFHLRATNVDFPLEAKHIGNLSVVGKSDPLILAVDMVANHLWRHLTQLSPKAQLNAPSSIAGWRLEDRVWAALDDGIQEFV